MQRWLHAEMSVSVGAEATRDGSEGDGTRVFGVRGDGMRGYMSGVLSYVAFGLMR